MRARWTLLVVAALVACASGVVPPAPAPPQAVPLAPTAPPANLPARPAEVPAPTPAPAAPPVERPAPAAVAAPVAAREAQEPDPKTVTVYRTKTGAKYHRAGCRYLSKSCLAMTLDEARRTLTPCSVCNPPQ
jgi:hypothetical protein